LHDLIICHPLPHVISQRRANKQLSQFAVATLDQVKTDMLLAPRTFAGLLATDALPLRKRAAKEALSLFEKTGNLSSDPALSRTPLINRWNLNRHFYSSPKV
jgi:hypothetical protein